MKFSLWEKILTDFNSIYKYWPAFSSIWIQIELNSKNGHLGTIPIIKVVIDFFSAQSKIPNLFRIFSFTVISVWLISIITKSTGISPVTPKLASTIHYLNCALRFGSHDVTNTFFWSWAFLKWIFNTIWIDQKD
jgi:hypothetical protein